MSGKGTRYLQTTRREIYEHYLQGESVQDLSIQYGMTKTIIYRWIKNFAQADYPEAVGNPQKAKLMSKEENKQAVRAEILSKSQLYIRPFTPEKIVGFIKLHKNKYGVRMLCDVVGFSRSTYYEMLKHDVEAEKKRIAAIKLKIRQILEESGNQIGCRKIKQELENSGIKISLKKILRYMHEQGVDASPHVHEAEH